MLQLLSSLLLVGSALSAPQDYQGYLSQLHQYRLNYLPASLNAYINSTLEEGRDVAYDLYDDIKEQVVDRTEAQVDQLTDLMEAFFQRAMAIRDSIQQVLAQEGSLSDAEIQERADREGLEELRQSFDRMEEEIREEVEQDEGLEEGVERMLQNMITMVRQMMVAAADKEAEFWSKLKQLEVQFWQMKTATADTTNSLRDWVTAAFQTLQEIDLNTIGGSGAPVEAPVDEPRAS